MVDGVVLLVDIIEGPKTQTKFVLQKALRHPKMRPLVVINKVDRPMMRDKGEVENDIFDIFATMASADEQFPILIISLDTVHLIFLPCHSHRLIVFDGFKRSDGILSSYILIVGCSRCSPLRCNSLCLRTSQSRLEYPTLYASGKAGFCARSLEEAQSENRPTDMVTLYETIRDVVPPPEPAEVVSQLCSGVFVFDQNIVCFYLSFKFWLGFRATFWSRWEVC